MSDATGMKLVESSETHSSIFSWTATWTNVWSNRKTEDLLVLVNNCTRFAVAVYEFKKKDMKNISEIIYSAIENTLYALNLNPELIKRYMELAGKVEFVKNTDKKATSWATKAAFDCAVFIGYKYNGYKNVFTDIVGAGINYRLVNYSKNSDDAFYPYERMKMELSMLTNLPIYDYKAYEIIVSLDLQEYRVTRKIIVPSNLKFSELHTVLQKAFQWHFSHSYEFRILSHRNNEIVAVIEHEDMLPLYENAVLAGDIILSDYLYGDRKICYIYDFGDCWEHEIKLVKVIDNYDKESPYLLEADGKTPPEDIGGTEGFLEFLNIITDKTHPGYNEMNMWAHYWTPKLSDWEKKPHLLELF